MAVSAASILNRLLQLKNLKPQSQSNSLKSITGSILNHLKSGRLQQAVSVLFASPEPFPYSLYAHLFYLCSVKKAIVEARKLESHLVTFSPLPPVFLLNRAIETYGKCGCLVDARELFDEMPERDGGSWNSMIMAYARNGFHEKALCLFSEMSREGILPNEISFACVLGSCGVVLELGLSRQVHAMVVKYGYCKNVILGSSIVDVYGKCGAISDARQMFDEIENPTDVSWNVIVRRYLEVGDGKEAVFMFFKMFQENVRPLNFTFSNALVACSSLSALKEGMQIHGVLIKINFEKDKVVSSSLINMYVKCGSLESARTIFDKLVYKDLISWTAIMSGYAMSGRSKEARELFNIMPERNVISWNAMLAGYIRLFQWEDALEFVFLMRRMTEGIDHVTLVLILKVCAGLSDVEMGKQVHGFVYRNGFFSNSFVGNALLDMYGKCGTLNSARVWFYQMSQGRDAVSWNALLTSYAQHQRSEQAITFFSEMQWESKPSKFVFGTLLAACGNIFALNQGKQIHGFMVRNGYELNMVIRGALVGMYCKCRCVLYALIIFKEADSRDVVLWNIMIFGFCHNGKGREALELIDLMDEEGVKPDHVTFHGILLACICEHEAELGKQYFNSMSNEYCIIPRMEHYECMIELYRRCGCMEELEKFIKNMPFVPTVAMLTRVFDACKKHGAVRFGEWAAELHNQLNPSTPLRFELENRRKIETAHQIFLLCVGNKETFAPCMRPFLKPIYWSQKPFTSHYTNLIKHSLSLKSIKFSQTIHAQLIKFGFNGITFLGNLFVDLYFKVGSFNDASKVFDDINDKNIISWNIWLNGLLKSGHFKQACLVFDGMPERDVVSWNSMISGCGLMGFWGYGLEVFKEMQNFGVRPSKFTFSILTTFVSCASQAKEIHCKMITSGVGLSDLVIGNSLIDMYGKLGLLEYAYGVFFSMKEVDVVSWNSLISVCCKSGYADLALKQFDQMRLAGYLPDEFTVSKVITVCTNLRNLDRGKQIFALSVKVGFISNSIVSSALIDLFSKCNILEDSVQLFEEVEYWDSVLCNSMISSYARHGSQDDALLLFQLAMREDCRPTEFMLSSALSCVTILSVEQGYQLHSLVIKSGFESESIVASSLVDMYSKIGSIDSAMLIFSEIHVKDLISWNTLIMGLAHNGRVVETLELFKKLLREGPAPDRITLAGVLLACRYGAFVDVGMSIFLSMQEEFGVMPCDEHYACVVDLLFHAGKFKEAFDTLEAMPFEPSFLVWESLVLATATYADLNLTERVAEKMIELKPQSSLPYLVLSRAYEMRGRWEGMIRVRKAMKQGLKKIIGCSWIGIKNHIFMFEADQLQHEGGKDLFLMLELLTWDLEEKGGIHIHHKTECAEWSKIEIELENCKTQALIC
ncbi:putative pentatricopeptide repeat-containing protein At5g09950 [Durio zibethinus]|uniref:Pentatricopeptide repeat-containing protein At5g09950 n=1 Tax=Durio zibethinus TaxID=66656 RepID=A0A6P6AM11_DURZI|nr:putative pentatricopeptide repeat-containing protein At5g09950 [Durio zibethinus]